MSIWLGTAVVLAFAWSWLFEVTFFVGPLIGLLLFVTFPILLLFLAHGGHGSAFRGLVGGVALIVVLPLGQAGHWTWSWISLQQHRSTYEEVIAQTGSLPDAGVYRGERYVVGRGQPRRVAFPRAEGLPDGWSAVVHDSSGDIGTVERRAIFNDQARDCIRITGPWHRCWFD